MGCLYAEGALFKCQCLCKGAWHGLLATQPLLVASKCSPAVEKRCKAGNEDGVCQCACGGVNHGLYRHVENFEAVPIVGYC